jgi:SAM-dependent methyltransferase
MHTFHRGDTRSHSHIISTGSCVFPGSPPCGPRRVVSVMSLIFVLPLSLILVLLAALLHQSHFDARVATVAGGYNASELATLRAHVRTRSHYYNVMRPEDHRLAVGGKWDEVGELQLRFLRAHGLLPEHRVLDLGCGALRAGIHLVRYLESGHYYGLDLNSHLINAGYERELWPLGLAAKLPLDHLKVSADFGASQFGVAFDFVIAHSVWTHLPLDEIGRCLRQVAPTLAPTGRFYATLHVAPENVSLSTTIVQHAPRSLRDPPRVVTHGDRDFFHVHISDVARLAHELGLEMRYLGACLIAPDCD